MAKTKRQIKLSKHQKRRIRAQRPLHRKFFLHPISVFLLLCVGVLLIGATLNATAAQITVNAKVAAAPITEPVDILSIQPILSDSTPLTTIPVSGGQEAIKVDQPQIVLRGVCPKNSYIKFYNNGLFAGATMCIGDPIFKIEIRLQPGLNSIIAQVYSLTDQAGPKSIPLLIYYQTSPSLSVAGQKLAPFYITSEFRFHGVRKGEPFDWPFEIIGQNPPYNLEISWGDKQHTRIVRPDSKNFTVSHVYAKPGGYNGYYPIKVRGVDAAGQAAFLQVMAVVASPTGVAVTSVEPPLFSNFPVIRTVGHWLKVAWPAYGIVMLMVVSFWLGERQEYLRLTMPKALRRRLS